MIMDGSQIYLNTIWFHFTIESSQSDLPNNTIIDYLCNLLSNFCRIRCHQTIFNVNDVGVKSQLALIYCKKTNFIRWYYKTKLYFDIMFLNLNFIFIIIIFLYFAINNKINPLKLFLFNISLDAGEYWSNFYIIFPLRKW